MNTNNLKVFNNDLIPVYITSDGKKVTLGRELHAGLKIETPYTQWFERMCGDDFKEDVDYSSFSQKSDKPLGGRPTINHVLTIRMAKHLCMIQRTPEGHAIRDKLIELDDNVEDYVQRRLSEERKRVYPVKASSLGEAVNWAKLQHTVQKEQGSAAWKRAAAFERTAQQFGIDIIPDFVEPPKWEDKQLALEAAPTMLIGHVDNLSVGRQQIGQGQQE